MRCSIGHVVSRARWPSDYIIAASAFLPHPLLDKKRSTCLASAKQCGRSTILRKIFQEQDVAREGESAVFEIENSPIVELEQSKMD